MIGVRRIAAATATAALLALGVVACGTTDVAAPAATPSAAPVSAACAQDRTPTSTGPVSLTDGVGRRVDLPRPATRVAVLEWQQVEDALTLCVAPVAVADTAGYSTYVSAEKLPAGTTDVGDREQPNLDALFASRPDLIIVEAFGADDPKVTAVSNRGVPVLVTKGADVTDPIGNMKNVFTTIATATGRTARGNEVIAGFDQHLAEAKQKVAGVVLPTRSFLFFDGYVDGGNLVIRPYGQGSLFNALGEQLGLTGAWTAAVDASRGSGGVDPQYGLAQTDVEGLTAVGAANLFYADDATPDSLVKQLPASPIWTSLPAVREGRAHAFPSGVWGAGGPLSNQQAIDAFVAAITPA